MQDERRRDPRYSTRLRAWCEGSESTLYVPVTNVSAGGVFVRTVSPMSPGERVRLVLKPDDREPEQIVGLGVVAWSRTRGDEGAPGMGVKLERIESGQDAFQRLIVRLRRRTSTSSQRIDQREVAKALREQDAPAKPGGDG